MRVLLDTNVLARWVNGQDKNHALIVQALRELVTNGHTLAIVPQCIYEFWVVATRPLKDNGLGMSTIDADQEVNRLCPPLFLLLQDERAIYGNWRELVSRNNVQGKSAHDARLVAAMRRHNLTHILTLNEKHFARYSEITAVNPNHVVAGNSELSADGG